MSQITLASPFNNGTLVQLAREIATDMHRIDKVLAMYKLSAAEWESLQKNPQFLRILESEVLAWNAAVNTADRTKLKAAAMLEQWLPEAYARMNDRAEPLSAKTELAKFVGRLGGLDKGAVEGGVGGERFSVTINLGQDTSLKISKELPARVIDLTPTEP